jgi:HPt (histidine-containing phosphotransfer) domain-containing protein
VLDGLRDLQPPGEPDFVTELIDHFVGEVPGRLEQLARDLADADPKRVERLAHMLKSSSANLGARELSRHCAALEASANAGRLADAAESLAALRAEYARVVPALLAERRPDDGAGAAVA